MRKISKFKHHYGGFYYGKLKRSDGNNVRFENPHGYVRGNERFGC